MILTKKIIPRSSPHGWKICHCCNAQVFYVRTRHNQNFKPLRWDEELQSDTWCRKKAIWLQHGCWLQPLKTRLTRRAFQKCVRSWPLLSFAWNTVKIVDDFFFFFSWKPHEIAQSRWGLQEVKHKNSRENLVKFQNKRLCSKYDASEINLVCLHWVQAAMLRAHTKYIPRVCSWQNETHISKTLVTPTVGR